MKRYAFFVGIDTYTNGIQPLNCACNDAKELCLNFAGAGFETPVLLTEQQATSGEILDKLEMMCNKVQPGDLLVFYFAGHGREFGGEHYLIAQDGRSKKSQYTIGSLPFSVLVDTTNRNGVHRLFILDCCRSNLLADRAGEYVCGESRDLSLNGAVAPRTGFIPPLVLNSCSAGQKAYEDPESGHGYFTKVVLNAMKKNSGVTDFSSFRDYLAKGMADAEEQNICWNGDVDSWNKVELFSHWTKSKTVSAAVPQFNEEYYELSYEVENWEKKFQTEQIPYSPEMEKCKRMAEMAKNAGDVPFCIVQMKKFSSSADTVFNTIMKMRQAEEEVKRQAAAIEAARKAAEEAKHRAEVEAARKAVEEARRKVLAAAEEAKRKAAEEAKRKAAEEEAKQKAAVAEQKAQRKAAKPNRRLELLFTNIIVSKEVRFEMVKVVPGTFAMSKKDGANSDYEVEHTKTLTKDFYLGKYPVTQAQYKEIMGNNPSHFIKKGLFRSSDNPDYPVENVSWYDAMKFCEKMNQYAPSGWRFTLPTETQWEFAARGGNKSQGYKFGGSDNLDDVGWFMNNSGSSPHPVGEKQPNELGLYDMNGNVWEWCLDNWESKSNNTRAEFTRPYNDMDSSMHRVRRGGSWCYEDMCARSVYRSHREPGNSSNNLGFRIALVPVR